MKIRCPKHLKITPKKQQIQSLKTQPAKQYTNLGSLKGIVTLYITYLELTR
jgi:hypothetical protein